MVLNSPDGQPVPTALLERAIGATLSEEGVQEGEVSVTFLTDSPILDLNRRWLGHDWIPDVLSFALHDPGEPPIGDVYVGVDQAARQAREHGVSHEEELVRLAVHGTLHILGYEHPEEDPESSPLFQKQERLVQQVMRGEDAPAHGSVASEPTP
ncbi:MAG: rRNA maturation RNase YbeY [Gemmatimonadota bacterium]